MSGDLGAAGFDELLAQARSALAQVAGAPPGGDEERCGEGEAADGLIRVRVGARGRVESVTLEPRAMRMASDDLAEQLALAVNAALDALVAGADESGVRAVDPNALAKQLGDLHDQSMRQMARITQGLDDVVARLSRASGQ